MSSILDEEQFNLLNECLKSASGIVSTLNQIKQKRKEMQASSSSGRDWEIVAMKSNDGSITRNAETIKELFNDDTSHFTRSLWEIHSVKRLPDGMIFTVGDIVSYGDKNWWPITGFLIEADKMHVLTTVILDNGKEEPNWRKCYLKSLAKVSPPSREVLFVTVDEISIYEGDKYWSVSDDFQILFTSFARKDCISSATKRAFSTKDAAVNYINLNKPVLSVSDIDTVIVQLSQLFVRDINKYQYNEELKKYVFRAAQQKINPYR